MAPLQVGDKFPSGIEFDWVPITDSDPTNCGRPQTYNASKEWEGKKVVVVSVPGAFTPGCQANHLPPYINKFSELKSKGVDLVAVIAYNDGWVMNAWGKVNKVSGDDILFLSDSKSFLAKNHGWTAGPDRNGRFALVIEKDGSISYAENESNPSQAAPVLQRHTATGFELLTAPVVCSHAEWNPIISGADMMKYATDFTNLKINDEDGFTSDGRSTAGILTPDGSDYDADDESKDFGAIAQLDALS